MKSPFPGMDPYLERYWRDVHSRLCIYACDALQPQLLPALRARVEERLIVESDFGESRSIYPDVRIIERHSRPAPASESAAGVAEPLLIRCESEPATEAYITIIDATTGGTLVTVIEFLSTSNKLPGEGQRLYRAKQAELREGRVSLVDLDLLREGDWVLQVPRDRLPAHLRAPYRACCHRGWMDSEWEYYHMPIDRPLPSIRIPLREGDNDAKLDLQRLIDQVYRNGAYDDIDYRQPPDPPLEGDLETWADHLLRSAGRR